MRAIMVCVDYSDILAITLPYNLHHFEEVWIVTDPKSMGSVCEVVAMASRPGDRITVLATELFYANGAVFNKWAALEWGLDQMGRRGWLCLMDADVLWPKEIVIAPCNEGLYIGKTIVPSGGGGIVIRPGHLCTPLRRMWNEWPDPPPFFCPWNERDGKPVALPPEREWHRFPIHRNVNEWAGYSQIFNAGDPALGPPPWHETDWKTAGAADSFFQAKWSRERKVRPPFECLHLGPAGINWVGRATPYADGSVPDGAAEKREAVAELWRTRRRLEATGLDRFSEEKIKR